MPRNIPVGNGEMLVAFDDQYRMRYLYWPHVGQPNHTGGHLQRFGIWADGQFAWIDSPGWTRDLRYKPDTMVTEVRLRHERLGVEVICNDAVDYWSPVYFRRVVVTDILGKPRDVRVFFHHDISVNESPVGDTVMFDPQTGGLVHYKDNVYFLLNGCSSGRFGVDHWATGAKRIGDAEGTWRDAEDGLLSRHSIAQGSVDSTIGFGLALFLAIPVARFLSARGFVQALHIGGRAQDGNEVVGPACGHYDKHLGGLELVVHAATKVAGGQDDVLLKKRSDEGIAAKR